MQRLRGFSRTSLIGLAISLVGLSTHAWSQGTSSFDVPPADAPISAADLATLVGPIALYADDLVSIVLPASTYPLQIVQASRFLDSLEADSTLQPDPNWDSSVVALLNYPEVLRMLDANIEWTWALGEAVLDEQAAVMDGIQAFRRQAMLAGNLTSDAQQTITQTGDLIEIAPADPEVIYIPYYEPERVVVVQPRPVIHYYSDPYPLYYYPYPYGYTFRTGFFWGVTTAFHIGWHSHALNVYHHYHHLHPYYGRSYYTPYYARRGVNININVNRVNPVWQPRQRRAARPHRVTNGTRVTVSSEGSVNSRRTRTETVTRTTQINPSRTQTRTQVNRNAQRSSTAVQNQGTRRQNTNQPTLNNTRVNRQQATQPQRSSRSTVQPQRSNQQRTNQQRANTQRSSRQGTSPLSPAPRSSNRATTSPSRSNQTFASPQQRSSSANRATVAQPRQRSQPSRAASPSTFGQRSAPAARSRAPTTSARSSSRQTGSAGRSTARTGQSSQNGRTRR